MQSCRQIETDVRAEADQRRQKGGKEMETEDRQTEREREIERARERKAIDKRRRTIEINKKE